MKKLLFLLAAVSLTLTSCMKEDETYKRMKPVLPGLNIYSGALTQNRIAMQPANAAIRLGMLVAEAHAQGKDDADLTKLTLKDDDKTIIFDRLFQNKTTLTKTADGDYVITIKPEGINYYSCEGTMTVRTNGKRLDETDANNPWYVDLDEDFLVLLAASNTPNGYQKVKLSGTTAIYFEGPGYAIEIGSMVAHTEEATAIKSNWSGSFLLTPPTGGESLAYSACKGKRFEWDGQAQGPSCVTFDGTSSTQLLYKVTDGQYTNYLQCIDGTEEGMLTGFADYNTSVYPFKEVKIEWALNADGRTLSETVTYGGVTVTL